MKHTIKLPSLCILFIVATCSPNPDTEVDSRAPILLIVVDDMGNDNIAPFGDEIKTPNLDTLAESGRLFTEVHTAPTCSPTRAMLLLSETDNHLAMHVTTTAA